MRRFMAFLITVVTIVAVFAINIIGYAGPSGSLELQTDFTLGLDYRGGYELLYTVSSKDGSEGKWVKCTVNGSSVTFQVDKNINNFLLASFNKGDTPSWDLKPKQTDDQKLGTSDTYNGSNYNWK